MKKIFNILLILISVAGLIGCQDDQFLEENPKTIFTPDNAFETSKQVDDQIVTAYRALASTYNDTWWLGFGSDLFDGEDYVVGFGTSTRAGSNYGLWDANQFNNRWTQLYQIASYATLALKGADLVDWPDESEKSYAVAQAKFFIGWAYLRLGELFGGVPIVEEYSETLKLDYVRSSRDETYQFAIQNFLEARDGLPVVPEQTGRVSKSVANHFLAEAYLAKGEYGNAITAATDVIGQHPLMTDRFGVRADPLDGGSMNGAPNYRPDGDVFYDLFRIGNYDAPENTESVWVANSADYETFMAYSTGQGWLGPNSRTPNWQLTYSAAPVFRDLYWDEAYKEDGAGAGPWTPGNIDPALYPGGNLGPYCGGFSIAMFAPTKYVVYKVWGGDATSVMWDDMRNSELNYSRIHLCIDQNHSLYGQPITEDMIVFRGDGDGQIFPMTAKVYNREDLWGFEPASLASSSSAAIYGRDKYLVRSAETYLIRAEAYLRDGQADMAADDINTLRERANCAKLFTEAEVTINTILDERVRELSYEEHRWATLLRIGGDVMKNQLYDNAKYVADQPVFTGVIDWELLPIPKDAVISVNSEAEIQQNPGWE